MITASTSPDTGSAISSATHAEWAKKSLKCSGPATRVDPPVVRARLTALVPRNATSPRFNEVLMPEPVWLTARDDFPLRARDGGLLCVHASNTRPIPQHEVRDRCYGRTLGGDAGGRVNG